MRVTTVTKALTVTAGAYSANDVVGGRIEFGPIPPGVLRAVVLTDLAAQAGAYQLVFFKDAPTAIADNDPYDIADADHAKIIGAVHLTDTAGADKFDFADSKMYSRQGLALPMSPNTLYGYLIALGTPTYAATTDVQVTLQFEH